MPRVLFISTSVPPLAESQTIRNVYLLRGLARAGFSIDVVAPAGTSGDASLLRLLPEGVRIHRTAPSAYDRIQSMIARVPGPARTLLRSAIAVGAGYVLAPDVRPDWARKATETARALGSAAPDLVISSAGSYTAHIAAARLAAHWEIPWLADYGDPWSFNPIPPASLLHIRWRNERLERRALRYCTAISVTTAETAELYRRWLGARVGIHVVPCGYTEYVGAPDSPAGAAAATEKALTIAYVGSASRGTRDLRAFLRAFAEVSARGARQVRLEIVGAHSPSFAAEAERLSLRNVAFTGWVSYEESLHRMHAADLLLLIGNAVPLQIPAKVFNYAATRAPILYLRQLAASDDPALRLLAGWPGVVSVDARSPELPNVLGRVLDELPALRASARSRPELPALQQYEWDAIGDRFAAIAWSLAGERLAV